MDCSSRWLWSDRFRGKSSCMALLLVVALFVRIDQHTIVEPVDRRLKDESLDCKRRHMYFGSLTI